MKRIFIIPVLLLNLLPCLPQNAGELIRISGNLELIKISEDAYLHVSYTDLPGFGRTSANGLIVTDGNEAFLFDTPWNDSLTMIPVSYLSDSMNIRIKGFVPNHWHEDCMGGLGYLQRLNIKSYANQKTIDIAREKNLPVPEFGFRDSLELKLGNKIIDCYYPGPAHSMDNIVVWVPCGQILFAGCMVKSMDSENLGNTSDGDISYYPATIDKLISKFRHARIVIPGHGKTGGAELLFHTRSLAGEKKPPFPRDRISPVPR